MSDFGGFHTPNLLSTAQKYVESGWSVIPLRGDSDPISPKAPAVAWADYQLRRPTLTELDLWFASSKRYARNASVGAIGIVCGSVSSLAVLDFDDAAAAESFALACPDLTNTMTVKSGGRGLPHYYFTVPRGQIAATKHVRGADFQSSGTYVVAPLSRINGQLWDLVVDVPPRVLSRADVVRITRFLDALDYAQAGAMRAVAATTPYFQPQSVTSVTELGRSGAATSKSQASDIASISPVKSVTPVTLADAQRYYQAVAGRAGRNNALFRTALLVRDAGWSMVRCIRDLLDVHVAQVTNAPHLPETPDQRRREGLATLRSVFSRPARQVKSTSGQLETSIVPNALREHLLRLGGAGVARVLDGLVMVGIRAGQRFTEKVACTLLQPLRIGRRTIMGALAAKFAPLQPPSEDADTDPVIEKEAVQATIQQTTCVFVRGANRVKSGGRPSAEYVMPQLGRLCHDLGITDRRSDALQPSDLASPADYRLGMQRALMQRRPGSYSRAWLSRRIGVSRWTLRRYDRSLGLSVQPRYQMTPITWHNLDAELPDGEWSMGTFLQTIDGKRFPPVRGLAARLLKRGGYLVLCRQLGNSYALQATVPGAEAVWQNEQSSPLKGLEAPLIEPSPMASACGDAVEPVHEPRGVHYCADCITPTIHPEKPCKRCGSLERGFLSSDILADIEQTKTIWQALWNAKHPQKALSRRGSSLTPVQVDLANRLYFAVRRAATDEAQWLSEKQAHKLVAENPANRVEWAITLLGNRGDLRNPAAFAYAIVTDQRNRRRKQQTGDLLAHLATSPYLEFFANADQITAMYEKID